MGVVVSSTRRQYILDTVTDTLVPVTTGALAALSYNLIPTFRSTGVIISGSRSPGVPSLAALARSPGLHALAGPYSV